MQRTKKRWLMFLFVVIVLSGAAGLGYMIARGEPRLVDPEPTPTAVAAGANDARISQDAVVTWEYEYKMCRHQIEETKPVDDSMVGLSFSQLEEKYPEVRIISFDSESLVLEKSFDSYCPAHYILKAAGDKLAVFRTRLGTDEQYIFREINVSIDSIGLDKRSVITAGKVFTTMQDLNDYVKKISQQQE